MNSRRLRVVTPPAIEPVTLAEALQQCHADSTVEDSWFTEKISLARVDVEDFHGRANINRTLELTLDEFPECPFELPLPPLVSVSSIKYYDVLNVEYSVTLTDLLIDTYSNPGIITLNDGYYWPTTTLRATSGVKIQYVAGAGASLPLVGDSCKRAKHAMLLHISNSYANREGEVPLPEAFYNLLRPDRIAP